MEWILKFTSNHSIIKYSNIWTFGVSFQVTSFSCIYAHSSQVLISLSISIWKMHRNSTEWCNRSICKWACPHMYLGKHQLKEKGHFPFFIRLQLQLVWKWTWHTMIAADTRLYRWITKLWRIVSQFKAWTPRSIWSPNLYGSICYAVRKRHITVEGFSLQLFWVFLTFVILGMTSLLPRSLTWVHLSSATSIFITDIPIEMYYSMTSHYYVFYPF